MIICKIDHMHLSFVVHCLLFVIVYCLSLFVICHCLWFVVVVCCLLFVVVCHCLMLFVLKISGIGQYPMGPTNIHFGNSVPALF